MSLFFDALRYILVVRTAILLNIFFPSLHWFHATWALITHAFGYFYVDFFCWFFLLPLVFEVYSKCKICELHSEIMKHFHANQFMIVRRKNLARSDRNRKLVMNGRNYNDTEIPIFCHTYVCVWIRQKGTTSEKRLRMGKKTEKVGCWLHADKV